jgi:hypothetical protein
MKTCPKARPEPSVCGAHRAMREAFESLPGFAFDLDAAFHQFDEALADRQPEAGPAETPCRRHLAL